MLDTRKLALTLLISIYYILDVANGLNIYVDNYETLNYKPLIESRRKRSIDEHIKLKFLSHNRLFRLKLFPIDEFTDVFHQNHVIDVDGKVERSDRLPSDYLYEGYDENDKDSHAHGSIIDGLFDGHIYLSNGTIFTVDKAVRYFENDQMPKNFHSIIYKDSDINHSKFRRNKRDTNGVKEEMIQDLTNHDCGLDDETKDKMRKIQESAVNDGQMLDEITDEQINRPFSIPMPESDNPLHSYAFASNSSSRSNRIKRDLHFIKVDDIRGQRIHRVRTCSIYLQADQRLYEHILRKEGNMDPVRTREEIVSLFYNHIKAVNQIYEKTNFNGVVGVNFVVQRISIYTPDTCLNGMTLPGAENPFCEENIDVSHFLNLNSQRNHSAFCLAYAMTYRDFTSGTLGLAWLSSFSHNTAGGICQPHQKYNEGPRGWVYRSLNTGIVTLVNYGNRVPTRVSQLTLAHEIGHNFGSPHDFPLECQPGLPNGNYIMFASATSGDKKNNDHFSPCSIQNISMVLFEVLKQPPDTQRSNYYGIGKRNCFQERTSAFCGNQIKEPGEECDCGFSDLDCKQMADECCIPHEVNGIVRGSGACKRKLGAMCSPSEGQCCEAKTCGFVPSDSGRVCREENDCMYRQTCDGRAAECPESINKPNGIPCQDSTKVCQSGSCNGSICAEVGLRDCFLNQGAPDKLCHLACEKNGICLSTFELEEFITNKYPQSGRVGQKGLLLHPGSPCNDYKGYCDIFRKCRSVDSNGPLARLRNLVFNKQTIHTINQWARENSYACIGIGVGVAFFIALFVKCCAVHTPSTNPNKMAAQSFYDTLRHPQTLIRRQRGLRPAAYSVPAVAPPRTQAPSNRANRQKRQRNGAPSVETAAIAQQAQVQSQPQQVQSGRSRSNHTNQNSRNVPLPSAPPLTSPPQHYQPPPPSINSIPTVIIVEPPPPYCEVENNTSNQPPPGASNNPPPQPPISFPSEGPPRGARKNKKQAVEGKQKVAKR